MILFFSNRTLTEQLLAKKIDLDGIVIFNYNQELYNQHMSSPMAIVESLGNTELFKHVELTVRTWSKQMERVEIVIIEN